MKSDYEFINCKDKQFNEMEFQALRNEQNMRLDMAYNHGYVMAAMILVFWAAIFAFCKDFYEIASAEDSIIGKSAFIDSIIACTIAVFCGIPALIIYPYSVKYHDNIRQIVSIATYIRVFYEYPSLIAGIEKAKNNNDKPKVNGWELVHCSHNIPRGNYLTIEYFIISIASILISLIFGGALFACIIGVDHNFIEGVYSDPIIITFIGIFFAYLIFLGIVAHRCLKNIKIKNLFAVYGEIYFREYLKQAQEFEMFNEDEARELKEYMEKLNTRDLLVTQELRNRKI